nr:MAG: polyprotein [Iflaviridae sp.]
MDSEGTSVNPVESSTVEQTSNVVNVDQGSTTTVDTQANIKYNTRVCEGSQNQALTEMIERFVAFDQIKWASKHVANELLKVYRLPETLFKNISKTSPNTLIFTKWMYFSFDMEFRVQLNANRYQVGQLLVAWNYDYGAQRIQNISDAVQAPHHIIAAPGNNVITFVIPYKWCYPYWSIKDVQDKINMISLKFFVLSPLSVPGTTGSECNVFIQTRFKNMQLSGMRDMTINPSHQMFRAVLTGVESMLRSYNSDRNRDNPTDPRPASAMVPFSSHSWCIGTNQVEISNVLRLDAIATTPHYDEPDEMSALLIARHFGVLTTQKWTTADVYKTKLFSFAVAPLTVSNVRYKEAGGDNGLDKFGLSPLGRMASLYAYWRGSIEYRFDFVASMFHTGRIAVCFVPYSASGVFDNDVQSYVEYFDLMDNLSFTFTCPYLCNIPWLPTSSAEARFPYDSTPPRIGDLIVYVVNPLIAIDGVTNSVNIIPYVRAGSDFKFAVPIFPLSFPLSIGNDYHIASGAGQTKAGYFPIYSGSWRLFSGKVILRYGNVSDHIAQFDGVNYGQVYKSTEPILVKTSSAALYCRYFARPKISGQETYAYLAPFAEFKDALKFATTNDVANCITYIADGDFSWKNGQVLEPVSEISHEGDDRLNANQQIQPGCADSSSSSSFFNEEFMDLKTLLRRYSLYCDISVLVEKDIPYGAVFYVVPLIPSGIRMNFAHVPKGNKSLEFQSRTRGGVMASIADGFRFFKGGMRVRIVFRNLNGKDLFLQVTHVPDRYIGPTPRPIVKFDTQNFVGNGYAYYSQSSRMNECIEMEIPYYLNADYGLLCSPDRLPERYQQQCTLGYLAFSTLSRLEENYDLTIQVFTSFADDMRFSSYQGFGLSCSAFQLPDEQSSSVQSLKLSQTVRSRTLSDEFEKIEHQMERIQSAVSSSVRSLAQVAGQSFSSEVRSTGIELGERWQDQLRDVSHQFSEEVMSKIEEVLKMVKETASDVFAKSKNFFVTVVSQLAHLLMNPSLMALSIATATLWCSFLPSDTGFSMFNTILSILRHPYVQNFMSVIVGFGTLNCINDIRERVVHQYDSDDLITLSSTLITAVATALGYKLSANSLKNCPNFMHYLLTHIREITMTAAGLVSFLKINLKVFSAIVDWILRSVLGLGLDAIVSSDDANMRKWCRNAQMLTQSSNRHMVFSDDYLQRGVFRMYAVGQQMLIEDANSKGQTKISSLVRELVTKLGKLQEDLIEQCFCPNARYDPFVLQIVGPPGIGKSELYTTLGIEMLESIEYVAFGDPIFVKTSGPAYWNGVRNQPVLIYDDFFFLRSGTMLEEQIAEFNQIKSCAPFNPPIAELENKKLRYNPLIVLLASNAAYWPDTVQVRDLDALHRRRDMLFEVRLKDTYTMDRVRREFIERGSKSYDHLEFARYNSVLTPEEGKSEWMSYSSFHSWVMTEWKKYHKIQLELYKQRLQTLDRLRPPSVPLELEELASVYIPIVLSGMSQTCQKANIEEFSRLTRDRNDTTIRTVQGYPSEFAEARTILRDEHPKWDIHCQERPKENLADKAAKHREELARRAKVEEEARKFMDEPEPSCSHQMAKEGEAVPLLERRNPYCEVYFDAKSYVCPHEQFFGVNWYFNSATDKRVLINPDHFHHRRRANGFPPQLQEVCRGDCYLRMPCSFEVRRDWVLKHYDFEIKNKITPSVGKIPCWAEEFFPEDEELDDDRLWEEIRLESEERVQSAFSRFKSLDWFKYLKKITKWLGILGAGFLAVFGAYKAITSLTRAESAPEAPATTADPWHVSPEYSSSGDTSTGRKPAGFKAKMSKHAQRMKGKFTKHQYDEKTPIMNLESLIMRNAFEMCLVIDEQRRFRQKGFGICGRRCFTTRHFYQEFVHQFEKLGDRVNLLYQKDGLQIRFTFKELEFTVCDESSLAILEFSKRLNAFRDIRKHIVSEAELGYLGRHGKFYEYNDGKHLFQNVAFDECEDLQIAGTDTVDSQFLPAVYKYPISSPGKCGSVLYTCSAIPRIIGIHVAGVSGGRSGYAQPILRELVEDFDDPSSVDPRNLHEFEEIEPAIPIPAGVEPLGSVEPELASNTPTKTQIVPSLMFDSIYVHQTEPAVLRRNDPRCQVAPEIDPVVKAIATHGNQPLAFDAKILDRVVEDMSDYIISTTKKNYLLIDDVLDDQIVFGGLPGGNINKLNLNASEGYPLNIHRSQRDEHFKFFEEKKKLLGQPMKGKHWLFDFEETTEGLQLRAEHPLFAELRAENHQARLRGEVPVSVFVDVLKDSRVSKEKIFKGKTRMFSMSPLEYTWACKKYFGVFQSAYQNSRLVNGTAIGINVHSVEWTELAQQLLAKGQNFIVGDYKSFGDTLARDVMWGAFDVILRWYAHYFNSLHTNKYREILREELFNAPHLVYNVMYRMVCGIPSGFALTVEINDLVNQLYMRYCWVKITGLPLSDFYRYCKLVTYGDDLIMSVNDKVAPLFTFAAIQRELATLNIEFQPAAKDGSVYDFLNFFEVTFLKCNFVKHHRRLHQFMAKLPLESCLDMLNWQYRDNDKVTVVFENSRAALMNLYGHGPKVYQSWRRKIINWISDAVEQGILPQDCLPVHFKSWVEVDDLIFQDSG